MTSLRAAVRLSEDTLREANDKMSAVGGRTVPITRRVEDGCRLARCTRPQLVRRRSTPECRLDSRDSRRGRSDTCEGQPNVTDRTISSKPNRCRHGNDAEVPAASTEFVERPPGSPTHGRNLNRRQQFVGLKRGRQIADKKVTRLDHPSTTGAPHFHRAVKAE
jgi:hypothetical protein